MSEFNNFIEVLKAAPDYVKENVMCYYYHNISACRLCPKKDCKAREPRPIYELPEVDPSEIAEYLVRIDEFSLFAVPNPKVNFNLFEYVIQQLGKGEYAKLFNEKCTYISEDKKRINEIYSGCK